MKTSGALLIREDMTNDMEQAVAVAARALRDVELHTHDGWEQTCHRMAEVALQAAAPVSPQAGRLSRLLRWSSADDEDGAMGTPYDAGGHGRLQESLEEPLVVAANDYDVYVVLFGRGADAFDGVADFRDDPRWTGARLRRPLGDFGLVE